MAEVETVEGNRLCVITLNLQLFLVDCTDHCVLEICFAFSFYAMGRDSFLLISCFVAFI